MTQFQKIAFSVFIILSITFGYFGYVVLKHTKQPSLKAITLIPDSCSVLITFDNYQEFANSLRNKNLIWQDLRSVSCFKEFEKHLNYFDSLINGNAALADLTGNNPIHFAFYPDNKFLIALNLKELSDEKTFSEIVPAFLNSSGLKLKYILKNGVLCISVDESFLQKAFDLKTAKLFNNNNFITLKETVNYTGASMYIHNPGIFNNTYSNINIKPESITLNGIKKTDTLNFYGDPLSPPLSSYEFLENIPILCNAFEVFAIKNAETLFSRPIQQDWWTNINEDALFNAKKQFYENLGACLITASLPSGNKALIVNINDSLRLSEILSFMKDTAASHSQNIYKLRKSSASFINSTFPQLKLQEMNFLTASNGNIILTKDKIDAEIFVNARINNTSILQNEAFKSYASKNLNTEFHYINYFLANSLHKEQLPFADVLKTNDIKNLKNISHCSFVSSYTKELLNYRFFIKYFQDNIMDEPNLLWTLNADSVIITQPYTFKNHMTGGNEIVFQTLNNNLYLQNATGKTLWKKHLNQAIRSEIYTVDAFKNGKYQMLFNTDNFIHLIDRNGNYVQGYPMKLPARATNKLCVFDYENKNDLRLFIACADNKIYNYTIWGVRNIGFKPYNTGSEVILPITYCKIGLSDYLITADRKGKIHAFSRKGDGRIDFKNKLVEEVKAFELEAGNSLANTFIIYYDDKNHIIDKVSLTDKKEIFEVDEQAGPTAYQFSDFDNNKIGDFVLVNTKKLNVYDMSGSKIYSTEMNGINPSSVSNFSYNGNTFITVFDKVNSKINIINTDQQEKKEYSATNGPLNCELFNDGKLYLIIVSGNKIKCYKL